MEECIGLQWGAQRCVKVHRGYRGVCRGTQRGVGRCREVHGGVCGCAEVHGQVCSGTWRCAEVHRGMCRGVWGNRGMQRCTEGYRSALIYVKVHGGVTEVHGGVYGGAGGQRDVWRWTESVQSYAEDCIEVCRGAKRVTEVCRGA